MTHRNFGIMNGPVSLGGTSTDRPTTRDAILPRDSIQSASQHPPCIGLVNSEGSNLPLFIPASDPFERGKLVQALIDVITVVFGLLFLCALAASVPLAVVIMFLVQFH